MYDHTQCAHHPAVSHEGFESLGVATYRASTIVFDSLQAYTGRHELGRSGYSYGLYGTPTSRTLEAQITGLHAGHATLLFPSGHAAIAGVSEEHLRRICQSSLGRSPMKQLLMLRMEQAAHLLTISDHTVEAVGRAVGYENPFAFSNMFKRIMGRRPSAYRIASAAQARGN